MYLNSLVKIAGPLSLLLTQCLATPIDGNEARSLSLAPRAPKRKPPPPKVTASTPIGGDWGINVDMTIKNVVYTLFFDTGSSDLLLCGVPGVGHPAHTYPLTDEQKKSKKTFTVLYDDGTEDRGVEVEETVTIAGVSTKMSIAVSTTCAMSNVTDGILGVSNYQKPKPKVPTLTQAMAKQLKEPTFAMSIASENANIVFGAPPDSTKYVDQLKTVNTDGKDANWGLQSVTFTIGTTSVTGLIDMDTGTSTTELPETLVAAYHLQIEGARKDQMGAWFIPCNTTKMPDLTFSEPDNPGYVHTIPGGPLLGSPLKFDTSMCDSFLVSETHWTWFPGFAFFSTHYTVFDIETGALSWAPQVPSSQPASNTTHVANGAALHAPPLPAKKVVSPS